MMTIQTKIDAAWKIFVREKPNQLIRPRNPSMPLLTLSVSVVVLLLFFCFYNFILPQAPSRMIRPSAALIPEVPLWSMITAQPPGFMQATGAASAFLLISIPVAFVVYGMGVYLTLKFQLPSAYKQFVIVSAVLFSFLGIWALPNINSDIYYYVMQGRIAAVHHQNPYYVSALDFPHDPLYPFVSDAYKDLINVYPPVWTFISMVCTVVAGSEPVSNLLVMRFLLWFFHIANIVLIAVILHRLNPGLQLAGIMFYGWNPIVVLLGTGKPDTVMAFFLLSACLLLTSKRLWLAGICLTLSALVKLITIPLVFVYLLWYVAQRDWRRLAVSLLTVGLTILIAYLPFLQEPDLFLQSLRESGRISPVFPAEIRLILMGVFGLVALATGLVTGKTAHRQLWGLSIIMLYFALFLTVPVNSWYLITFVALVSITLDLQVGWLAFAISAVSFFLNTWELVSSSVFPLSMGAISRPAIFVMVAAAATIVLAVGVARRLRPVLRSS